MAKCLYLHDGDIGMRGLDNVPKDLDLSFIQDNIRVGEKLLNIELEKLSRVNHDIAIRFLAVQRSVCDDCLNLDCVQTQDSIRAKLKELDAKLEIILDAIIKSDVPNYSKHRYFILLSTGVIDHFKRSMQTFGRLSDLDPVIFLEERRKPMISPESTTIHSSTQYWLDAIFILDRFRQQSKTVFSDEYDFISELDFVTIGIKCCKILFMDFTLVSFILFHRLANLEELKKGFPFLCPCQSKTYFRVMRKLYSLVDDSPLVLCENLTALLRLQDGLWPQTDSLRSQDIIPMEPCIKDTSTEDLSTFVFWHLYGLEKYTKEEDKIFVTKCSHLKLMALRKLLLQFTSSVKPTDDFYLSPFQEERLKLILFIVNWFCEKDPTSFELVAEILDFVKQNWSTIGTRYFDKDTYRVSSLTMFQLFTKLINEMDPIYTRDGQANLADEASSESQKRLRQIWSAILEQMHKGQVVQPAERTSKQLE